MNQQFNRSQHGQKHVEMRLDVKFGTVILTLLLFMLLYSERQTALCQRDKDKEEEEGMHWHGASVLEPSMDQQSVLIMLPPR